MTWHCLEHLCRIDLSYLLRNMILPEPELCIEVNRIYNNFFPKFWQKLRYWGIFCFAKCTSLVGWMGFNQLWTYNNMAHSWALGAVVQVQRDWAGHLLCFGPREFSQHLSDCHPRDLEGKKLLSLPWIPNKVFQAMIVFKTPFDHTWSVIMTLLCS